MKKQTRVRAMGLSLGLALAGCGGSNDTDASVANDSGDPSTGRTYTYVISEVDVPPNEGNVAIGFDLDDKNSDGLDTTTDDRDCTPEAADYVDVDGNTGIDNQVAELVRGLASQIDDPQTAEVETAGTQLAQAIRDGLFIVLVELSGVDDLENDDNVELQIFLGAPPAGQSLQFTEGRLTPGQTIDVNRTIMRGPGPVALLPGAIVDGVLTAGPGATRVALATETPVIFQLFEARFRATVAETSLTNGVLGGRLVASELSSALRNSGLATFERVVDLIDMVLAQRVDLGPVDGAGMCTGLSAATSFTAVPAVRGVTRDL